MHVLALTTNTEKTACTRFRLLQYAPYLQQEGIALTVRPFLDERLERALYRAGGAHRKIFGLLKAAAGRIRDLIDGLNASVIYVLREAALIGPPLLEIALAKGARRPLVFDVDDPVWERYASPVYGRLAMLLKMPQKANTLFRLASHVIAGNAYVARYARRFTSAVTVIPTVVDTEQFTARSPRGPAAQKSAVTVGWVGSHSTAPYLESILEPLCAAGHRRPFRLLVVGAGKPLDLPATKSLYGAGLEQRSWTLKDEIASFQEIDIGLYPIRKDRWSVGKSAFKAIQYGAVGIPTVASPVGAVRDVVIDGKTGVLAETPAQWAKGVTRLIADPALRDRMGRAARKRIHNQYSLQNWAPRWVEVIKNVATANGR
jgi:glycosyltransferase involved in cell wall biosynthesis